ncbi:MAG: ParB/RepB/Spo0J family partition protein [Chloroflexi bacterium]|nr:ParB/RepB/Spo0J family partition protein [Chloroflexota bacterium]
MSSGNKRRFFDRDATPVVATDDDFDAVFGPVTERATSAPQDIPIDRIRTNPFQARMKFKDIDELAESMRTHGFTSRLRVRRDPAQPQFFQLVYGERRLRAAHVAGIKSIPCDVAEYSDQQMREIGLTENLQRSDLEPLEEARAFRVAIDEGGYSMRSLAAQIGKSKGYVQGRLDLLRAPEDVQRMVDEHPETFTAALLISQIPTPEQRRPLIESVIRGDLDKESVRGIVRDVAATAAVAQRPAPAKRDSTADDDEPDEAVAARRSEQRVSSASVPRSRRSAATIEQNRVARQSERALERATQTLRAMINQLQEALPELREPERAVLLDYIAQQHFPELEEIVEQLRESAL